MITYNELFLLLTLVISHYFDLSNLGGDKVKIFKSARTLVAFVLIAFYYITNILYTIITSSKFSNIVNTFISLLPILFILCFLLFEHKDFGLKKYIFPLAFGLIVFKNLYIIVSVISTQKYMLFENETIILFAFSLLLLLFNIMCFIGTLFEFKYLISLKIGCIGYILATITMQIYEFILLGGMEYVNSIPKEILPISIFALVKLLSIILFYIGIFILTTNKNNSDLV